MTDGVTGAQGFIGRRLVTRLGGDVRPAPHLDDLAAARAFARDCETIYHLAGKNRAPEGAILANNLRATGNLVLACRGLARPPRVVFASSVQVETQSDSEYGFTKGIEEMLVQSLPRWSIVRLPNVYGPGARPNYNSVVATFARQVAQGQRPKPDDAEAVREFLHVDDAVAHLMEAPANTVVRSPGERLTIGAVADLMTERLGDHPRLAECVEFARRQKELA